MIRVYLELLIDVFLLHREWGVSVLCHREEKTMAQDKNHIHSQHYKHSWLENRKLSCIQNTQAYTWLGIDTSKNKMVQYWYRYNLQNSMSQNIWWRVIIWVLNNISPYVLSEGCFCQRDFIKVVRHFFYVYVLLFFVLFSCVFFGGWGVLQAWMG